MVQTIRTLGISPGQKLIIIEKPRALIRIFFSLLVITTATTWYDVKVSFDDPSFFNFYSLTGGKKYFEATGVDIFQGNVWVSNLSDKLLYISATEILH